MVVRRNGCTRVQETLTEMLRELSVWAGLDNDEESTHLIVDSCSESSGKVGRSCSVE